VDGMNRYGYCRDNPLYYIDPTGWDSVVIYPDVETEDDDKDLLDEYADAAEGFDHGIGASGYKEAAELLNQLVKSGVDVTELHIFGHGTPGTQYLGEDVNLSPDPFGAAIRNLPGDTPVYLHGCHVAKKEGVSRKGLQFDAKKLEHTLVAWSSSTFIQNGKITHTGAEVTFKPNCAPTEKPSGKPAGWRPDDASAGLLGTACTAMVLLLIGRKKSTRAPWKRKGIGHGNE